ncbi:MAG: hypothetical protein ABFD75_14035 [Smithella sp.]
MLKEGQKGKIKKPLGEGLGICWDKGACHHSVVVTDLVLFGVGLFVGLWTIIFGSSWLNVVFFFHLLISTSLYFIGSRITKRKG